MRLFGHRRLPSADRLGSPTSSNSPTNAAHSPTDRSPDGPRFLGPASAVSEAPARSSAPLGEAVWRRLEPDDPVHQSQRLRRASPGSMLGSDNDTSIISPCPIFAWANRQGHRSASPACTACCEPDIATPPPRCPQQRAPAGAELGSPERGNARPMAPPTPFPTRTTPPRTTLGHGECPAIRGAGGAEPAEAAVGRKWLDRAHPGPGSPVCGGCPPVGTRRWDQTVPVPRISVSGAASRRSVASRAPPGRMAGLNAGEIHKESR